MRSFDAYQRAATLTHNQYDAGIVSRADVEQAETQLESARAEAIDIRLQRAQLEHAMAILVGKAPADLTLTPVVLTGEPPEVPSELPSRLLERRPDIAAAERRVAAANADVGVASAAFFPTVLLGATGGFQSTGVQQWLTWPMRFWSLGPSLAATVFDAGARHAARDAAAAAYDETAAAYRQAVLTAFQDVEDNLAAQRLLAAEGQRQQLAVASAQRLLDISMNQYRAGIVSYLQVASAQTALLANQRTAVSLTARRYASAVELVRALGGEWGREIGEESGRVSQGDRGGRGHLDQEPRSTRRARRQKDQGNHENTKCTKRRDVEDGRTGCLHQRARSRELGLPDLPTSL